jgi:hypothetical protein
LTQPSAALVILIEHAGLDGPGTHPVAIVGIDRRGLLPFIAIINSLADRKRWVSAYDPCR